VFDRVKSVVQRLDLKYLLLIALAGVGIWDQSNPCQGQPQHKSVKKSAMPTGVLTDPSLASASEGVQLVEEIFQKLRNSPQIALTNSKQLLAFQSAPMQAQSWGSADSNLLIRPAQGSARVGYGYRPRPGDNSYKTVRLEGIPSDAMATTGGYASSIPTARARTVWEKGQQSKAVQQQGQTDKSAEGEDGEFAAKEATSSKIVATFGMRPGLTGSVVSSSPLITEFKGQSGRAGSGTVAGTMTQLPQTNAGKPGQLDLNEAIRRANSPQFSRLAQSLSGAGANVGDMTVRIMAKKGNANTVEYAPNAAFGPASANTESIAMRAPVSSPVDALEPTVIDERHYTGGPMEGFGLPFGVPGAAGSERQSTGLVPPPSTLKSASRSSHQIAVQGKLLRRAKAAREEVALLPLTKVSGIPLVNLGDSDLDLSKRLESAGTVHITVVKPWTVWSVKPRGSQEYSLQVFLQKGVVEAVRVKDNTLWTNQQGIALGDEVSVVKEKFGEPAFILSHPVPSGNKTYVYPISQVAFRLERSKETDSPRIKDIIIFAVK
jgi:hypothetical protein